VFPDSYQKFNTYLRDGQLVWLKGKNMGEGENRRISLSQVMLLLEAFEKLAKGVKIRIFLPGLEESTLTDLKNILESHAGKCPVTFELETPHSYRLVTQSAEVQKVSPTEELVKKVESLLGEKSVTIEY
jgi:DNA polymerase-3 subunit alpha